MASHRSLLLRVEVKPAGRKCNCAHNKAHVITKGEPRLVVKVPGIAQAEKGYCAECGAAMVAQAEDQLRGVSRDLGQD
jgi:uncharacterized Zn-binding protein involved in type VI secretion